MANTVKCPNCSAENSSDNTFCQSCGTRLSSESAPPPPPQHPVQQPSPRNMYASTSNTPGLSPQVARRGWDTVNLNKLGTRLDGWADLVDNAGNHKAAVQQAVVSDLKARRIPYTEIENVEISLGGLNFKPRPYLLCKQWTGASIAVFINDSGRDLYLAWDLFVRPIIKWNFIGIMAGIALVLSILTGLAWRGSLRLGFFELFLLCFSWMGWLIPVTAGALILGKVMYNKFMYYFVQELDDFSVDDVGAMMLAVHHAILKAVDSVGLDVSLLRVKENFKAGQRDRII